MRSLRILRRTQLGRRMGPRIDRSAHVREDERTMTYAIVRYRQNPATGDVTARVTRRGLTLDQAQAHCSDDKTHGPNWFDGYRSDER